MKPVTRRFEMDPYICHCHQHAGATAPGFTLEVAVDQAAVARLLWRKAAHNRTRRAVEAGGAVVVRVIGELAELPQPNVSVDEAVQRG